MKQQPVVLLVEDNPDDLALMQLAIERAQVPMAVVVAADGQEALEWVLRRGAHIGRDQDVYPALLLLDLNLPVMGGLQILKTLREEPEGRVIPVVVLTTSTMPADIATAYELGANAFVQKPMEFPALVNLVKALAGFWLSFNITHPALR